jgi:hypothetical protein
MALYLAARQLEMSQGWLYDYFIFADDDLEILQGNFTSFESSLKVWQPSIGCPQTELCLRSEVF